MFACLVFETLIQKPTRDVVACVKEIDACEIVNILIILFFVYGNNYTILLFFPQSWSLMYSIKNHNNLTIKDLPCYIVKHL